MSKSQEADQSFNNFLISIFQDQMFAPVQDQMVTSAVEEDQEVEDEDYFQVEPKVETVKRKLNFTDKRETKKIRKEETKKEEIKKTDTPKQITKEEILKFLNSIMGLQVSEDILADITYAEDKPGKLNVVGRAKATGSSNKQMRHVTPHSFIEKIIRDIIERSLKADLFLKLSTVIRPFLQKDKGFCLDKKDLKTDPYQEINKYIEEHPESVTKFLSVKKEEENSFIFSSPNRGAKWFPTPTKQEKAQELFAEQNKVFVRACLHKLNSALTDPNTTLIASEILARYIFTLFNQQPYVAFPKEGNTLNDEIRLYQSRSDAENPKDKKYEILTAREIKEKIDKKVDLNLAIRIVNCEGSDTKKIWNGLAKLDQIISEMNLSKDVSSLFKEFNSKYNLELRLANSAADLTSYNDDINNYSCFNLLEYKVAKLLYYVFDFKALEEYVFVPKRSKDIIKVYNSASSNKTADFKILEGKEYRADKINEASGYNSEVVFRSNNLDEELDILAIKAAQHLYVSLLPFPSISEGFVKNASEEELKPQQISDFYRKIIGAFNNLIKLDYQLSEEVRNQFDQSVSDNFNQFHHVSELEKLLEDCSVGINGESYDFLN